MVRKKKYLEKIEEIKSLYISNNTVKCIAKKLNMNHKTVRKYLVDNGIKIRSSADAIRLSFILGRKPSMIGKKKSLASRLKQSRTRREKYSNKEYKSRKGIPLWKDRPHPRLGLKNKISSNMKNSLTHIEKCKNKEYRDKMINNAMKSKSVRPTSYESLVLLVIKENNLPFRYVGDGQVWIDGANPDFIHSGGKKICVEVYNSYHHPESYGQERINHFIKYGWTTILIPEEVIKSKNNKEIIFNKLIGEKLI